MSQVAPGPDENLAWGLELVSKLNVGILNVGGGNVLSVVNAIEKKYCRFTELLDARIPSNIDVLLLPGVGSPQRTSAALGTKNAADVWSFLNSGKKIIGICLGMQMLFDSSIEFGDTLGLGIVPGRVLSLKNILTGNDKLPHVCWSEIYSRQPLSWKETILNGITNMENMYFVHSYYAQPLNNQDVLSSSSFSGIDYCSTVKHKNVYGCQFHPEKSAESGLKIISNFVNICRG